MQILQDIKTAVKLTGAIRKARKNGADSVQIKPVYTLPCVNLGPAYLGTIECGLSWQLGKETDRAVREVFKRLPHDTQRWLNFTPREPGGWGGRARFWQRELKPVLPADMYHKTLALFIGHYSKCLRKERRSEQYG